MAYPRALKRGTATRLRRMRTMTYFQFSANHLNAYLFLELQLSPMRVGPRSISLADLSTNVSPSPSPGCPSVCIPLSVFFLLSISASVSHSLRACLSVVCREHFDYPSALVPGGPIPGVVTLSGIIQLPDKLRHSLNIGPDTKLFAPPMFGVTVLGSSHGFDPKGSTSGYVLWVNRRGVMVDPPPHSSTILEQNQIHPSVIDAVIVTHCHAGTQGLVSFPYPRRWCACLSDCLYDAHGECDLTKEPV